MSGVEAAAVLGVISSVIAIVDGTKKVYDAASSATGIPIAFREVSTRLPIVKGILESTKQHIDDAHIDTASYSAIKTLIEACEERAKRLKAIFDKVIPGDEDSRLTRYISAAKTLGQGERVETLMQGLMKDVLLLASKHVMELATSQQVVGLTTSIKELSAVEPSLPDAALEDTAFTNNNFGNGPMTNNNVMGNQKFQANYGTGKQFQAEEQIFHMENGPVNEQSFHAPVQQYFSSCTALTEDQVQQICEHGILEQLKFHDMQERYYDIPEAHQETFEWIYGRTDLKFVQWLRGGTGVYWITGKAGSGKSTLMKFIYQNQKTHDYLSSDIENTLVASFFFHDRGHDPLLTSQEGLFRAILYSALSKYRQLIRIALPERYERLQKDVRYGQHRSSIPAWSANELKSGFKAIISQSQIRLHLCLLIDGLDEFSGNYEDIIDTLNHLLPTAADSHVRVQMCLSSRPLAVFEESYSRHTHLQVQDLTADDIKLYVMTKFNAIPRTAYLLTKDPTTTDLIINEILDKAQGVFLWVTLVVRSLIEGLRNRDNMDTLRRRLSDLPSGLKPLYKRMIEKIDPLYHRDAGRTFNMVRLAARPLSPLVISFSDHEPREALLPQNILSDAQLEMRHSDVSRQLKAHTSGLIEMSEMKRDHRQLVGRLVTATRLPTWEPSKLQYLHLTVKEFLLSDDVPAWLANEASTSALADTHLKIAACCLRQLRVTESVHLYDYAATITKCLQTAESTAEGLIFLIMFHIRQAERATNASSFSYLESLDQILTKAYLTRKGITKQKSDGRRIPHWTLERYDGWEEPRKWRSDYISFLVTIGMTHSVVDAFNHGYNPAAKAGRPLLLYATCRTAPPTAVGDLERDGPEPAIIEELLKRKCDPNQRLSTFVELNYSDEDSREWITRNRKVREWSPSTVWAALLSQLSQYFDEKWGQKYATRRQYVKGLSTEALCDFRLKWLKTIDHFLDHGANTRQIILHCQQIGHVLEAEMLATHRLSALSLYDQVFANFDNPLVSAVRASMVEKGGIEFVDDFSKRPIRLYDDGVSDHWISSLRVGLSDHTQKASNGGRPAAKSRFVAFFQRALSACRSREDKRPRTEKRNGCVQS